MNLSHLNTVKINGWKLSTVGAAAEICNNFRFPINEEVRGEMTGEYPYYGPTGVLAHINEYRVEGEFALIGEDGDHFLKFRDKTMTLLVSGKFNVNNHAHLLRGGVHCITKWLFYFYMHADLSPLLTRQGVGRFKLTKEAISKLPLLLPPLPEQRKIAEILTIWDEALEKLDSLIAAKERRKKSLMQQLLTGKKRMKGLSSKRLTTKLGNLFTERVEQTRTDLPLLSITADRGIVRRDDLVKRDTSSEDKSKYLRIAPGDIGYNTMRMWQGVSALSALEGIVSPAYTICTPNKRIDARFAAHFFKFHHTIHLFHRYSQGLVDDTLNLKFPAFATIEVTIPADIEEQIAIASILDTCDKELLLLRSQRTAIDQQKRGLMQKLLTGEVRVLL